ncbi:MAG: hypothetical protein J7480_06685 [Microbacteriaceae bacterium]|nr:hypothetical protein [Microbacteriaceae bacterium]
MPTSRPRYAVTETDELKLVLDRLERQWPGESRSRLLLRVVETGVDALRESNADVLARRRREVREGARMMPAGIYPEDWREQLHNEWPE